MLKMLLKAQRTLTPRRTDTFRFAATGLVRRTVSIIRRQMMSDKRKPLKKKKSQASSPNNALTAKPTAEQPVQAPRPKK